MHASLTLDLAACFLQVLKQSPTDSSLFPLLFFPFHLLLRSVFPPHARYRRGSFLPPHATSCSISSPVSALAQSRRPSPAHTRPRWVPPLTCTGKSLRAEGPSPPSLLAYLLLKSVRALTRVWPLIKQHRTTATKSRALRLLTSSTTKSQKPNRHCSKPPQKMWSAGLT